MPQQEEPRHRWRGTANRRQPESPPVTITACTTPVAPGATRGPLARDCEVWREAYVAYWQSPEEQLGVNEGLTGQSLV